MTTAPRSRDVPGFRESTGRVFAFSLGQMLWSKRTIFMLLVVAAPLVIAVVVRGLQASGVTVLRGARVGGVGAFGLIIWLLYVRFIVPVLGVFYGTSLIADEVEDRTITYLFTRPIPRSAILVGKYLAYLVCTSFMVLPSVMFVYVALVPAAVLASTAGLLLQDLAILGLGLAAYGAVFALIGAVVNRPLIVGIVFTFGWETLALVLPGYLNRLTVAYFVGGLVPHAMPFEDAGILQSVARDGPSPVTAVAVLICTGIAGLCLAVAAVRRREYVLGQ